MIRLVFLYLLSSLFFVHASETLVVQSKGCVMEVKDSPGISFFKTDDGISFAKYKYKDGRSQNIQMSCAAMSFTDAVATGFVQEADGLKIGTGMQPLSKASHISGTNWSGWEGIYYSNSYCFNAVFEAGRDHVFMIDKCGNEEDIKALRKRMLLLLKGSKTYHVESGDE
ncbi:hypothetical protein [Pseudomonas sp. SJZ131]|uniref:hypothetical protein n=1 Tax=Pseudomonas sp. SJZ131 TaxID=2572895 RepID=UPI001198E7C8|nr:hypothetical protein [Pseudomonas sp. SJZ131]TWD47644.1 hypothetical protein FBY12_3358 [Pseudomonas sp. SJZ131]